MIRLVQHIPNFVDGVDPKIVTCGSQTELLAVPWVAHYANGELIARNGEVRRRPFWGYSLSDDRLMAEYDEGRHWWVIGTITDGREMLDLPKWVMHPDGRRGVDEWNKGNWNYDDGRFSSYPLVDKRPERAST
jgi:hypothetical protein